MGEPCSGISRLVSHSVRQSMTSKRWSALCAFTASARAVGTSMVIKFGTRRARSARCREMRSRISSSPGNAVAIRQAVRPGHPSQSAARCSAQRDLPLLPPPRISSCMVLRSQATVAQRHMRLAPRLVVGAAKNKGKRNGKRRHAAECTQVGRMRPCRKARHEGSRRLLVLASFPAGMHLTAPRLSRHASTLAGIRAGGCDPCVLPRCARRPVDPRHELRTEVLIRLPLRGQLRLGCVQRLRTTPFLLPV